MRILLISPTYLGIGGVAQHVRDLTHYLRNNGHEVDIMSSGNTPTIPIKKLKNPSFIISSFLKSKFMKEYDIVHAQHPVGSLAMKNISGRKILSIHGIFSKQIEMLHGELNSKISDKLEKNGIKWADVVTAGSKESFDYYKKFGKNVILIPNGIDIKNLPIGVNKLYENQVIFVGRLSKEKGIDTIIEMTKKLSDEIHLVFVGSGPEENKIIELSNNMKNIHYLGFQSREKTIPLIRGSNILIQPSLAEGISATLLEAMACKTPVIVTRVGGNLELFENEKNGILIEPNNHQELLSAIESLLKNHQKSKSISDNAYDTVKNYDWSKIGKKYLDLYENLISSS